MSCPPSLRESTGWFHHGEGSPKCRSPRSPRGLPPRPRDRVYKVSDEPRAPGPRELCPDVRFKNRYAKQTIFEDRGRRHFSPTDNRNPISAEADRLSSRGGSPTPGTPRSGSGTPRKPPARGTSIPNLFSDPPQAWVPARRGSSRARSRSGSFDDPKRSPSFEPAGCNDVPGVAKTAHPGASSPRNGSVRSMTPRSSLVDTCRSPGSTAGRVPRIQGLLRDEPSTLGRVASADPSRRSSASSMRDLLRDDKSGIDEYPRRATVGARRLHSSRGDLLHERAKDSTDVGKPSSRRQLHPDAKFSRSGDLLAEHVQNETPTKACSGRQSPQGEDAIVFARNLASRMGELLRAANQGKDEADVSAGQRASTRKRPGEDPAVSPRRDLSDSKDWPSCATPRRDCTAGRAWLASSPRSATHVRAQAAFMKAAEPQGRVEERVKSKNVACSNSGSLGGASTCEGSIGHVEAASSVVSVSSPRGMATPVYPSLRGGVVASVHVPLSSRHVTKAPNEAPSGHYVWVPHVQASAACPMPLSPASPRLHPLAAQPVAVYMVQPHTFHGCPKTQGS